MKENICVSCKKSAYCREPFPQEECPDYDQEFKSGNILRLFRGMSPTMQRAVYKIMEATQTNGKGQGI